MFVQSGSSYQRDKLTVYRALQDSNYIVIRLGVF